MPDLDMLALSANPVGLPDNALLLAFIPPVGETAHAPILVDLDHADTRARILDALGLTDGTGNGNVIGPATSTGGEIAVFNGVTGKVLGSGPVIGTGANNVLQLDGSGKLPVAMVDGIIPGGGTMTGADIAAALAALADTHTLDDTQLALLNSALQPGDITAAAIISAVDGDAGISFLTPTQAAQVASALQPADLNAAAIKSLYESNADTNVLTDALMAAIGTATGDMSDAAIKTAYENNADTNAFDDDAVSKLAAALSLTDFGEFPGGNSRSDAGWVGCRGESCIPFCESYRRRL